MTLDAETLNEERRSAQIATIQLLLDRGLDVNARDEYGRKPLLFAINLAAALEVIEFLLERGANPILKDKDGNSPCNIASQRAESGDDSLAMLFEGGCQARAPTATTATSMNETPTATLTATTTPDSTMTPAEILGTTPTRTAIATPTPIPGRSDLYRSVYPPEHMGYIWWEWERQRDSSGERLNEFEELVINFTVHNDVELRDGNGLYLQLAHSRIFGYWVLLRDPDGHSCDGASLQPGEGSDLLPAEDS